MLSGSNQTTNLQNKVRTLLQSVLNIMWWIFCNSYAYYSQECSNIRPMTIYRLDDVSLILMSTQAAGKIKPGVVR